MVSGAEGLLVRLRLWLVEGGFPRALLVTEKCPTASCDLRCSLGVS